MRGITSGIVGWLIALLIVGKILSLSWFTFAAGVLALGTLGFWILLAIAAAVVFAFIDNDDGVGATGTLAAFFVLLKIFGNVNIFSYVRLHPLDVATWAIAYFAAGTLWSIAKWWFYCRAQRELYNEKKKSNEKYGLPKKPSVSDSKDKILRWMTFWPWSLVWTIINDPIKRLFREIYRAIEGILQRIADKAWDGAVDE